MTKVHLPMLKQLLTIVCPKILKIMPADAYNASIILKCLATHTYCAQNYASIICLPLMGNLQAWSKCDVHAWSNTFNLMRMHYQTNTLSNANVLSALSKLMQMLC